MTRKSDRWISLLYVPLWVSCWSIFVVNLLFLMLNVKMWGKSHPVNYWQMNMSVLASDWRWSKQPMKRHMCYSCLTISWRRVKDGCGERFLIHAQYVEYCVDKYISFVQSFRTHAFSCAQGCYLVVAAANPSCPRAKEGIQVSEMQEQQTEKQLYPCMAIRISNSSF